MKNIKNPKPLCLITALIVILSAFVFSSTAAEEKPLTNTVAEITEVNAVDNDNITAADGYDHGYVPTISAFQNANGSYTVCIQQKDSTLKIVETDKSGKLINEITVAESFGEFAAFTKGSDGTYYALFCAPNLDNDKTAMSLRLNNYSIDGKILRTVDMPSYAPDTFLGIRKLNCGNNVLCENGNYITGYIGREMLAVDGIELYHQASYGFAVDLKTFTQLKPEHPLYTPYVTHSFHQYIIKDGTDFIYVDRGDADPKRSFHITKMSGKNTWEILVMGDSFEFKGEYGSNETYGQLGGLVKTNYGYLLVGTYQNTTEDITKSPANIFTQIFDTNTLATQKEKYITNYTNDNIYTVSNPKAAQISADTIAVPYMLTNNHSELSSMRIAYINGQGELTGDKAVDTKGIVPRYGQVFYNSANDSIDWFSVKDGMLVLYSTALENSHYVEETTTSTPPVAEETTTKAEENTTQSEPTTATTTQAPETQTHPNEQPAERSFFQRIIDFFVGIYNWIVNFFTSLIP